MGDGNLGWSLGAAAQQDKPSLKCPLTERMNMMMMTGLYSNIKTYFIIYLNSEIIVHLFYFLFLFTILMLTTIGFTDKCIHSYKKN